MKTVKLSTIGKAAGKAGGALGVIGLVSSGYEAYEGWTEGDYGRFASATFDVAMIFVGYMGPAGLLVSLFGQYVVKPHINFDEFN